MQSRTKNRKSRQEIVRLVGHCLGSAGGSTRVSEIEEITDGWFNAIYRVLLHDGRRVVLKVAPRPDVEVMAYERDLMRSEVSCMRLVASHRSIPVPRILHFDESLAVCDSPFFLMEEIAGVNYAQARDALDEADRVRIEREIGRIVRAINGFSGSFFGYQGNEDLRGDSWSTVFLKMLSSVLRDADRKQVAFDFTVAEIEEVVRKHAHALLEVTEPRLVHWDLWDSNVLVRDGEITGVIDFERALWADPLMEAQFRPLSVHGGTNHYLHGYGKTTFSPAEIQRNHLYLLHLGLVMNVECYFRHYGSSEVFELSRKLIREAMRWLSSH